MAKAISRPKNIFYLTPYKNELSLDFTERNIFDFFDFTERNIFDLLYGK